jgi:pimeloyl-ACP methyl ester carboxylesterase
MKLLRTILLALLALLVAAFVGFAIWASNPLQAQPEALEALQSDGQVEVQSGQWLIFQPAGQTPDTGFVFYPGGRVDYRAYAPLARATAAEGYLVIVPRMPLNMAFFAADTVGQIIREYPEIRFWAVGGHSLGGAMAANFLKRHPEQAAGLILLGSYPANSDNLSSTSLRSASIYGSLDGGIESIENARMLLPSATLWTKIEGGNHAQFGNYGPQPGDRVALISSADQQSQAVAAILALLDLLSPHKQ